jgi:hypothetical protein
VWTRSCTVVHGAQDMPGPIAGKRAETILNVLSFAFIAILLVGLTRLAAAHWSDLPFVSKGLVGQSLAAVSPDVRWPQDRATVVFFLRSTCSYCQASVPFHRQLARLAADGGKRVMVITDEPVWQMTTTLKAESLDIADVHPGQFSHLGLVGTPTILEVSPNGTVNHAWQGLLTKGKELEVAATLGVTMNSDDINSGVGTRLQIPYVPESEVPSYQTRRSGIYVIDVRSRSKFSLNHIDGALNIPMDELEVRAIHELPRGADVAVFCQYYRDCESSQQAQGKFTRCSLATILLNGLGFHARLLPEKIDDSQESRSQTASTVPQLNNLFTNN